MSEQDSFMLMFALGPVQVFIEQARKTRDLWMGSLLLSTLMEAAMENIPGHFVFPVVRKVGTTPDIPNKYVALFPSAQAAQQAAQQSREQIKKRWEGICQIVWEHIIQGFDDQTTRDIWQRQTDFEHLFEVYWAIVPKQSEYKTWLNRAEQVLSARKRLRDFLPQDEPGEKSAISGEREILHRQQRDSKNVQQFWKSVATQPRRSPRDIDQDGEERLDSIDTIKRFATIIDAIPIRQKQAFPSTSSIAVASFVESLLTNSFQPQAEARWREAFQQWGKATANRLLRKPSEAAEDIPFLFSLTNQVAYHHLQWLLRLDGDLYFPATFTTRRLEKDYAIPEQDAAPLVSNCKAALKALLDLATEQNITRPTPYYGIIQMDGDHMGMLLGGAGDPHHHQAISQALSTFAHDVALPLVEQEYPARLVYAGGDDVLAFAPLGRDRQKSEQPRNILELVDQLQLRYAKTVSEALPAPQEGEGAEAVTASIGIAIAHHVTSLAYALRSARTAEQAAKKRYGRNALVVTLLRRSGEQTQVGCHWRYPAIHDQTGQPIALFTRFYTLFQEDLLSPKCVHFLLEEAPALVGLPSEARESEVKRVLLRQLDLSQQSEEQRKALTQEMMVLANHIATLAKAMDAENNGEPMTTELHALQRRYGLVEVFGWLLVMAFLARKDQDRE